jgi:uncharacterized membrane protein
MAAVSEPRLLTATYEAHIERPMAEVFAFLSELPNTPRWRERMDEVSWLEPGRTFKVVTSFGPWRTMELRGEVTASEPPHRFAYRITEGPLKAQNEYRLEEDGDAGTRFTMHGGAAMGVVMTRLLAPVLRASYGRTTRKEVARLQQLLS